MNYNIVSYLIGEGFKNVLKNKKSTFAAFIIMFVTMITVGLGIAGGSNITSIINQLENDFPINVYIEDTASQDDIKDMEEQIKSIEYVNNVTYTSKEKALEKERESLGDTANVVLNSYTESNHPFPASFTVTLTDLEKSSEVISILQQLDKLKKYVPDEFNTYYEPFVGGGALLFELSPKNAVINDSNKELMNVYECIKDEKKFEAMCRELNTHEMKHSEEYYYTIRNMDRDKKKFNKVVDYKRAARTIYLNKACFNGLYRVNSKNEFNVPFGKKTKVNTYEGQNLGIICGFLNYNDIKILSTDFEEAVKEAKKGDFIYFDPPYDSDTSTFNSYTEDGFGKEQQKRLAKVYRELSDKGCYVMLSNHNTELINELYKDYNIHLIEAKRSINANGKKRGKVEEVIITNYENKRGFDL